MSGSKALVAVLLSLAALVVLGCEADYRGDPILTAVDPACGGKTSPKIVGGYADSSCDENPAVVRVEDPVAHSLCTGTLIRDDLVLTAGHCVAPSSGASPTCAELPPIRLLATKSELKVTLERGSDASEDHVAMTVDVKEVMRPDDDALCGNDVAVLVLARSIPPRIATPMAMRLGTPVAVGEKIEVIGFGLRDYGAIGRRDRTGEIAVERVGPTEQSCGRPTLKPHEFETSKSFCQGDSGGPAIDVRTRQIVGVVSRNISCSSDVGFVYTELAGHRAFLERALRSETAPEAAPGPSTAPITTSEPSPTVRHGATEPKMEPMPLVFGSECTKSEDCDSGYCVLEAERSYCSRTCDTRGYKPCPTGWTCSKESSTTMCVPRSTTSTRSTSDETVERRIDGPSPTRPPLLAETESGGCSPSAAKSATSCEADGALLAFAIAALSRRRDRAGAKTRTATRPA